MHHSNIATLAAIVHSLKQHYINRGNGIYSHLNFCKAHLALTKTHERNSDLTVFLAFTQSPYCAPKSIKAPRSSDWSKWETTHCTTLATLAFLRRCDMSRPLEEYLSRARKFVILKRALSCAIDQRAPRKMLFFDFAALFHHT